jgi:periplasmic glucans biosynthesis protein, mdoG
MNFEKARYNMVEQQIRPHDVLDLVLLSVLSEIPRENFVLPEEKKLAYAELPLHLLNGGTMLRPALVARLIQALQLNPESKVLEIGTGSGYVTAILAKLSSFVVSVDQDLQQLAFAKDALADLCIDNIELIKTDGLNYGPHIQDKQYDAVYIGGAVHHIPEVLLSTLKENGRLIAIVASHFPMQAICFERDSADNIKSTVLFETDAPYLIESSIQDADLFNF